MDKMTMREFLCCVETIAVDHFAGGSGDRVKILELIHATVGVDDMTEETWGASTAAEASQRAMIDLVQ